MSSTKPQYRILAEKYPGTVVLQRQGNFYIAFDASAIALFDIFNCKLNQTKKGTYKCGFPLDLLPQRLKKIQDAGLGYVVYDKDKVIDKCIVDDKSVFDRITTDFVYLPRNNVSTVPHVTSECVSNTVIQETERDYQKYVLLDSVYERFKKFCASKSGFDPEVCFNWIVDDGLSKWGF